MTHEARYNGTHALKCDTPNCHMELLAPDEDALREDANLAGWVRAGEKGEYNVCPDCTRGQHPGAAILRRMLGGDEIDLQAPAPVRKDDAVLNENGDVVGHYMHDANQGDKVRVKVKMPEVEPPRPSARYAEMMGDEPDEPIGTPAPKPRNFHAAPGTDGGDGIVSTPKRPTRAEVAQVAAKAPAKPRGPVVNEAAMRETQNLFGFLDGDTGWTPDDN